MARTTVPAPVRRSPAAQPPPSHHSRSIALGWLALAAAIALAGVLLLATLVSTPPQPEPAQPPNGSLIGIPRTPELAQGWLAHHAEVLGGPASGPGSGWPVGMHHSADAAERWFSRQQPTSGWPEGLPRTADAAERWFLRND